MKRIVFLITFFALLIATVSCRSNTLPIRFERFVDRVDKGAPSYTKEEWTKVSDEFTQLMDEFDQSYDKLSKDDRTRISKCIGRYRAIALKSGVRNVRKKADDAIDKMSDKYKDFKDQLGSFWNEIREGIRNGLLSSEPDSL